MQSSLKNFFFFFILLTSFNCFLQQSPNIILKGTNIGDSGIIETIQINVIRSLRINIGTNKHFYLDTNFNDKEKNYFNSTDIEEKTSFINTFRQYNPDVYNITCRLRKQANGFLIILCKLSHDLPSTYNLVYLNSTSFIYKSYKIIINPPTSYIMMYKLNTPLIFLYADEQSINIEESKDTYDIKFKIEEYNNEILYLNSSYSYIPLDKCSKEEKYLKCEIEKTDIEKVLQYNNQKFLVYTYLDSTGEYQIPLIENITINDNLINKQDIYVGITNLIQNYTGKENFIAYKTNITNISNFVSGRFKINRDDENITCYFKKDEEYPLLFLCHWNYNDSENELGIILNENIINNSSINYNFFIQPINNIEKFSCYKSSITPYFSFPKV